MPLTGTAAHQRTRGNAPPRRAGTPVASLGTVESGSADPTSPTAGERGATGCKRDESARTSGGAGTGERAAAPAERWGGARNRRDRESDRITLAQARAQIAAAEHAVRIGLPLNRHCTVHWERQGVTDAEAAAATRAFLKSAGEFLRTRGLPFAWAFQRENGSAKGSHVHILMHVPASIRRNFVTRQRRWIRLASGRRYERHALRSTAIAGASMMPLGRAYEANLGYVLAYVLKGATHADAATLGLRRKPNSAGAEPRDWGNGGTICGKRVGRSANLDAAARRRDACLRETE